MEVAQSWGPDLCEAGADEEEVWDILWGSSAELAGGVGRCLGELGYPMLSEVCVSEELASYSSCLDQGCVQCARSPHWVWPMFAVLEIYVSC